MLSDRQQQIIEESIKIIANKGIQGFTIKNLAKSIGISEPGIYRHFESKTEILLTILNSFREMAEMFSGIMETFEGSALEKIAFMFTKMIDLFSENPSIVSVIFSEEIFKNEEVLKEKIIEIVDLQSQTIEKIVCQGQLDNTVRNDIEGKALALIVMGALRLMVKKWNFNNHSFNLSDESVKLIEVLSKLLAK